MWVYSVSRVHRVKEYFEPDTSVVQSFFFCFCCCVIIIVCGYCAVAPFIFHTFNIIQCNVHYGIMCIITCSDITQQLFSSCISFLLVLFYWLSLCLTLAVSHSHFPQKICYFFFHSPLFPFPLIQSLYLIQFFPEPWFVRCIRCSIHPAYMAALRATRSKWLSESEPKVEENEKKRETNLLAHNSFLFSIRVYILLFFNIYMFFFAPSIRFTRTLSLIIPMCIWL